jgi:hypothetical protein
MNFIESPNVGTQFTELRSNELAARFPALVILLQVQRRDPKHHAITLKGRNSQPTGPTSTWLNPDVIPTAAVRPIKACSLDHQM